MPNFFNSDDMHNKTLADIGVEPGWYCRHSGCSIWFEVLDVSGNALTCVARDPRQPGSTRVVHNGLWSGLWALADGRPDAYHWIDRNRRKSFFDKFHPERDKIIG